MPEVPQSRKKFSYNSKTQKLAMTRVKSKPSFNSHLGYLSTKNSTQQRGGGGGLVAQ